MINITFWIIFWLIAIALAIVLTVKNLGYSFFIRYNNENIYKIIKQEIKFIYIIIICIMLGLFLIGCSFYEICININYFSYSNFASELYYHPTGLAFGIAFLILGDILDYYATFNALIKNFFPKCGSVRYTVKQIDEQANDSLSKWLGDEFGVYVTPKIIIGTRCGVLAVEYGDIKEIYLKKIRHIERVNPTASKHPRYKERYTFQLSIETKNNKKLKLYGGHLMHKLIEQLKPIMIEKCGRKFLFK